MTMQLILIDDSSREWKLDDATRERGRRGIEAAREILARAQRHADDRAHEGNAVEHRHAA